MKNVANLATALAVIGAINLGLIGLGGFLGSNLNVLGMLVGSWPVVANIVYLLIGVAGVMVAHAHITKRCHL